VPDLACVPMLLRKNGSQELPVWTDWLFAQGLDKSKALGQVAKIRFSSLDQAIHAAVAGAGIAIVDKAMVVQELRQKRLRLLPQRKTQGPFGYWWVQLAQTRSAAAEQFQRWLMDQS